MVFSLALLSTFMVLAMGSVSEGTQQVNEGLAADTLRREAIHALQLIAQDLKATDRGSVATAAGQLTITKGTGWTSGGGQTWDSNSHVYRVINGRLMHTYAGLEPQLLAADVLAFTITPNAESPLASTTVTLALTLRRQIGVEPDGSPHYVQVATTRSAFVRANL
jgi:hypothetical protein